MRVRCSAVSVPLALILVSVLLLLPVLQPAQAESRTAPLEALSWERRVLLLFADHPADPWAYKQRLDLLEAQLAERHVRERTVAAQAAGEQPEGLDLLELGLGEIELAVAATRGKTW